MQVDEVGKPEAIRDSKARRGGEGENEEQVVVGEGVVSGVRSDATAVTIWLHKATGDIRALLILF